MTKQKNILSDLRVVLLMHFSSPLSVVLSLASFSTTLGSDFFYYMPFEINFLNGIFIL